MAANIAWRLLSLSSTLILLSGAWGVADGFTIGSPRSLLPRPSNIPHHDARQRRIPISRLHSTLTPETEAITTSFNDDDNDDDDDDDIEHDNGKDDGNKDTVNIVLTTGFESFNRDLYQKAGQLLPPPLSSHIQLQVFSDSDIRSSSSEFATAVQNADLFIGSLIFDYDDVMAVSELLPHVKGPRLLFECATELMTFNKVGSFNMEAKQDGSGSSDGPPPAVKAILNKFSSGKEEDKINGSSSISSFASFTHIIYASHSHREKASDLRCWLEAYRYWNQGGLNNVKAMLQLVVQRYLTEQQQGVTVDEAKKQNELESLTLPELEVTPDIGLLHPLLDGYASHPKSCKSQYLLCHDVRRIGSCIVVQ
eukprot:scaffold15775_cov74-Skeletonema_dohrnii-CCMP3373.AAC.2